MMFRLLLHSLMRGDTREPRAIIEANSWYLIRDPESIKASHTITNSFYVVGRWLS